MGNRLKLFVIAGLVAVAATAFALGVPLSTLLFAGVLLLCPAAMFFGMGAMGADGGCHSAKCDHAVKRQSEQPPSA